MTYWKRVLRNGMLGLVVMFLGVSLNGCDFTFGFWRVDIRLMMGLLAAGFVIGAVGTLVAGGGQRHVAYEASKGERG